MKKATLLALLVLMMLFAACAAPAPTHGGNFDTSFNTMNRQIQSIENQYMVSNQYVPEANKDQALNSVMQYAEQRKRANQILYYEKGNDSVYMKLADGTGFVYMPNLQGVDASGSDLRITTLQPCNQDFSQTVPEDRLGLPDSVAKEIAASSAGYIFSDADNLNDGAVTLEALKQLSGCGVLIWQGHGGYTPSLHSFLLTGVRYTSDIRETYDADFMDQSLILTNKGLVAVTSKFFDKYLAAGSLAGSMVYLGACSSGADSALSDMLRGKGAQAVFANSGTVYTVYDLSMIGSVFDALTSGNITASAALDSARNKNGEYDNNGTADTHGTQTVLYGNADYTLGANPHPEGTSAPGTKAP